MYHDILVIANEFECDGTKEDMAKFLNRTYYLKTGQHISDENLSSMLYGTKKDFVDVAQKYHPQYKYITKEEEELLV